MLSHSWKLAIFSSSGPKMAVISSPGFPPTTLRPLCDSFATVLRQLYNSFATTLRQFCETLNLLVARQKTESQAEMWQRNQRDQFVTLCSQNPFLQTPFTAAPKDKKCPICPQESLEAEWHIGARMGNANMVWCYALRLGSLWTLCWWTPILFGPRSASKWTRRQSSCDLPREGRLSTPWQPSKKPWPCAMRECCAKHVGYGLQEYSQTVEASSTTRSSRTCALAWTSASHSARHTNARPMESPREWFKSWLRCWRPQFAGHASKLTWIAHGDLMLADLLLIWCERDCWVALGNGHCLVNWWVSWAATTRTPSNP